MGRYVVKVPDIGEGMTEAEIVAWHVAPGQVIREEDPLVDVMTDKATVELPAPVAGTVVAIHGTPARSARSARSWSCSMSPARAMSRLASHRLHRQPHQPASRLPHPLPACGEREDAGTAARARPAAGQTRRVRPATPPRKRGRDGVCARRGG